MNAHARLHSFPAAILGLWTLLFAIQDSHGQTAHPLTPVSGADGLFQTVTIDGVPVYRSTGTPGSYARYMYFQTDVEVRSITAYLEVTYKDIGFGNLDVQYNATTSDYELATTKAAAYVQDTHGERTAVFELTNADFRNAQNLGTDLRIVSEPDLQMNIISATVYLDPPPTFLQYHGDWISPYRGPRVEEDDLVDATTLDGKVICGYQGWFRAPGDPSGRGWEHYVRGDFSDLTVEMWPDMDEYTADEKYAVPGWTHADGDQAYLFSSANKRTILRHFQWMQAYGIDGVAVQRFIVNLSPGHPKESFRIAGYAREAANRTGRTYFIMYDMSGFPPGEVVDVMRDDWRYLVDDMRITEDDRYLHHDGKPVVGVFGFFSDRFSSDIAHAVLDAFQTDDSYEAFVLGSGEWWWRTDTAPGWADVFQRMDGWIPWNVGNYSGSDARTDFWREDQEAMAAPGVLYMPLVYPGFAWDNLMDEPPGTTLQPRRKGEFMWRQLLAARDIDARAVYVAMFDEIDEATAIFKVANDVPVNHYFLPLEGLPSDFYLLLTGFGTRMINGTVPDQMPDFALQSQPPIPDILSPAYGDTLAGPVTIAWTPATHASGIDRYELMIDDQVVIEASTARRLDVADGTHTVQVRAINGLSNPGGFSETLNFTVDPSTGVRVEQERSTELSLSQSYPNPFHTQTAIQFSVPESRHVRIEVFDVRGIRVATLVDGPFPAGSHTVTWNASNLASGLYLCRMEAGPLQKSKRLVLLK